MNSGPSTPSASKPTPEPVSVPASKPKVEFSFRPTGSGEAKVELPPNPALERFKMPEPPTPLERLLPVIKGVVTGLAVLLLLLVALYFIPLPGQDDSVATDRVTSALRTVRAVPSQHHPILSLKEATLPLRNTADSTLVASLLGVVALGELRSGDRTTGLRQCEYIVNTYTGAPAAQLVRYDALTEPCKACKGTGRVAEAMKSSGHVRSMDSDTLPCMKCQGKGRVLSDAAVDVQYAKALDAAESDLKAQNRNGAMMSFLLRFQGRMHRIFGRVRTAPSAPAAATTNAPPL